LKKRPHIEPGTDTFEKPLGKGNRKAPGLRSSKGVEHRRRERDRLRRQRHKTPLSTINAISPPSSKAIYLQRKIFTRTNGWFPNRRISTYEITL
jgi:hypothetical protein